MRRNYFMQKLVFSSKAEELIKEIKDFIKAAEYFKLTDEQWFIEFENQINKLSIKDHNADAG